MSPPWTCPKCRRRFSRKNQRHACGTGNRSDVLENRPAAVVSLYEELEAFVKSLGRVEFVTRNRYVLLRSNRIFTDLVVTPTALRVVVHLRRRVRSPLIVKTGSDGKRVPHVAMLRGKADLAKFKPYIKEAYEYSLE